MLILSQLVSVCFCLKLSFSIEMRFVKEMDNFHYGVYGLFSLDFGSVKKTQEKLYIFKEDFENIFLSSEEMDEIRNQINYMLEEEDENEVPTDFIDETDSVITDSPDDSS